MTSGRFPLPRPAALQSLDAAQTRTLVNGLTLAVERRATPGFSFHLRLPLGSAHDPAGQEGTASVVEEWLYKGAGELDAHGFQDALDDLGMRRGGGTDAEATFFAASGLNEDLGAALTLYADLLRRPTLPSEELPCCSTWPARTLKECRTARRSASAWKPGD